VCLILVPWDKLERFAQRTGQLRLAQSIALIMIGILAIANIVILVSSGLVFLEYRNAESQLNQDKTQHDDLGEKYSYVLTMDDFEFEIYERQVLVSLFDWVKERVPSEEPWILITLNPTTTDFEVHQLGNSTTFYLTMVEPNEEYLENDGWPILISTEIYLDYQLSSLLEEFAIVPFPSSWFNISEQPDLVIWLDEIDARPVNFNPNRTLLRSPLTWRVMEVQDNGNGMLDVSVSSSCLIVNEETIKMLEKEADEISQLMILDESIPRDEDTLEDKSPLLLIGSLLVFMAVPGTAYYSWRTMKTIRDWKHIQQQYWGALQEKLESLQEGLVLRRNRVNGYPWADLEHFVDWNKPVTIKIANTKYKQLLRVIYQVAPLETTFIVQDGDLKDRFIKETGQFAIDFSQPLEMENENQLTTLE
jgi:hypothetical protein